MPYFEFVVKLIFCVGLWIETECGREAFGISLVKLLLYHKVSDSPLIYLTGYVSEIYGAHFQLPDLGPIGSLATRHMYRLHEKLASEFDASNSRKNPTQLRWRAEDVPDSPTDFIDGFVHYLYTANKGMKDSAFMVVTSCLFLRLEVRLWIETECGREAFGISLVKLLLYHKVSDSPLIYLTGYVSEIYGAHFQLPDLGPIEIFLHQRHGLRKDYGLTKQEFSPFNVVACHGNYGALYGEYSYDLQKFYPYNTVLIDHGDPSINTVLTAPPTDKPGVALLDFVIFPPRWLVAEHTFRPPYYLHERRLIARVVNAMAPTKLTGTMAFMFESPFLDHDYYQCWIGLKSHFSRISLNETNVEQTEKRTGASE
ncbi:hypothetical protein Bca52824_057863 [Brassica carinata]|uniref:homogentisate 1,2-dioxygenase n=1 Tax=Brassica carinata TaxID=52824 RepID=A0A8X7QT83_BRACI|nr:hypothetical protein Bca52824_057863 [Brassica carinata]